MSFCPNCGARTGEPARFCQQCGLDLEADGRAGHPRQRMAVHVQILGWLLIASAILTSFLAAGVFLVGSLLPTLPIEFPRELGPGADAMIAAIVSIIGVFTAVVAGLSAAAGIGILQYRTWGRVLALIAASVYLTKIPIGTAIGIYAFWVLLSVDGREHFRTHSVQPSTAE